VELAVGRVSSSPDETPMRHTARHTGVPRGGSASRETVNRHAPASQRGHRARSVHSLPHRQRLPVGVPRSNACGCRVDRARSLMHVIYIHQHFSTRKGATGTRSYEMSRRPDRAGHRVTMICGLTATGDLKVHSSQRVTQQSIDGIRVASGGRAILEPDGAFWRRVLSFGRFAPRCTRLAVPAGW